MSKPKGYYQQYKKPRVHVQVYEEAHGKIPKGYYVDHIDGDIHNNSLSNLRLVTPAQNMYNTKTPRHNKSGIKGVSWDKARGVWRAAVKAEGKQYTMRGDLLSCVAFVYRTRRELHGEYARFR